MRPKKKVTLATIAEKTGVSTVTVSNALSGRGGVSSEVKKRIEECAMELGYSKSGTGHAAEEETVYISALVKNENGGDIPEETGPFIHLLEETAERKNVKLSIGILQNISGKHTPQIYWPEKEKGIIRSDGILLCGKLPSSELRALLDFFKVPAVGAGFMDPSVDIDYLMDDGFRSIRHAVQHVKMCGASDIMYATEQSRQDKSRIDRLLGFKNALYEEGLMEAEEICRIPAFEEYAPGRLALRVKNGNPPEAVVCASDQTAEEVTKILTEAGYIVPEDVLVTGYREGISSDLNRKSFSSCVVPLDVLAQLCLDLLKKRILRGGKPKGVRMIDSCFAPGVSTEKRGDSVSTGKI